MSSYWLYTPEVDEAGCVAEGDSPEAALKHAQQLGWYPDAGEEVQWYVLGEGGTLIVEHDEELDCYHDDNCDGNCDNVEGRNACLSDEHFASVLKHHRREEVSDA